MSRVQTGGPINMVQFWKDVAEKVRQGIFFGHETSLLMITRHPIIRVHHG